MFLTTNFIYQLLYIKQYGDIRLLISYWSMWTVALAIFLYSHFWGRPKIMLLVVHLLIIRNIVPLFDLENRQTIQNIEGLFSYALMQIMGLLVLLVMMSQSHRIYFHVPFSLIYHFLIGYGLMCIFFKYKIR